MKEKTNGRNNLAESTKQRGTLGAVLTALFWLALWEVIALIVNKPLLFPGIPETVKAFALLLGSESFYLDILSTLLRCIFGVVISFVLGYYLAALAHRHHSIREFLKGPVRFFKAVPVMAIIIYLILLVSSDAVAVIVCLFMCFPIAYTNILGGLDNMPQEYLELAYVFKLTEKEIAGYIKRPAIAPYTAQALSLMSGMSFKVVIASEVLSIPTHSLGYEMLNAKYYLDTPSLFAYIAVIIVMAVLFEKVVEVLLQRYAWRPYEGSRVSYKQADDTTCGVNGGKSIVPSDILTGISKTYPGTEKPVLDNFDLKLENGKVTALMGPSGIGKTTIARIIAGLEQADQGTVNMGDAIISYMFQEDRLFPWLNVYDNMALSGIDSEEQIRSMAEKLEITDSLYRLPSELSGGMRQRAALGRTLLRRADLIILDEPFKGLDEELKLRIKSRLWDRIKSDKTVLFITHDSTEAAELSDKVIHI